MIATRCSFMFLPLVMSAVGCGPIKQGGQGGCGGTSADQSCPGTGGTVGTGGTAGAAGSSEDGGLEGGSIVDASATDADDGGGPMPPPGCLPDCLVDAIRRCLPTFGACVVQKTVVDAGLAFPRTETRTCDLATHWEVEQFASSPLWGSDIIKDGQLCFGRRGKTVNVGGPGAEITYLGLEGEIARGAEGPGFNSVLCKDGTVVELGPPSAECLPWRAVLNPTATCTSQTDGVCP
jgi:hypothetical protein